MNRIVKYKKKGGGSIPVEWVDAEIKYIGSRYIILHEINGREYSVRISDKGLNKILPKPQSLYVVTVRNKKTNKRKEQHFSGFGWKCATKTADEYCEREGLELCGNLRFVEIFWFNPVGINEFLELEKTANW